MQFILSFFSTSILPVLATFLGGMVIQGALSLGVGVVTYAGMSVLFDSAMNTMISRFGGLPSDLIQMLGLMGVDEALNIMFSAGVTLLTIKGMSKAGSFSRQTWGKPE